RGVAWTPCTTPRVARPTATPPRSRRRRPADLAPPARADRRGRPLAAGPQSIVSVSVLSETPPSTSVTRNVMAVLLGAVGLPVIAPVAGFSARPAASVPSAIDHVSGVLPPLASSRAP